MCPPALSLAFWLTFLWWQLKTFTSPSGEGIGTPSTHRLQLYEPQIAFWRVRPWYSYAISWLQFVPFWPRKRKCSSSNSKYLASIPFLLIWYSFTHSNPAMLVLLECLIFKALEVITTSWLKKKLHWPGSAGTAPSTWLLQKHKTDATGQNLTPLLYKSIKSFSLWCFFPLNFVLTRCTASFETSFFCLA